jgi:hypothetical protein
MVGERPDFVATSATLEIPAAFEMPAAQTVHVDDGFESGVIDSGTWTLSDGGLGTTWTVSSQNPSNGTYSVYCDDDAPASGPYTTDSQAWLYTASPMDLSSGDPTFLTYDYFLDLETGDELSVMYATGATFPSFSGFKYTTSPGTWNSDEIDLSSFPIGGTDLTGESQVWIAFVFTSDASANTAEGVYLDDIRIVEDPDAPSIVSINPPSGSAGTDTEVTITGTGFGAVQGSGAVDFTYDEIDGTTIEGQVTSWSDTEITCIIPIVTNPSHYRGAASSGPVNSRSFSCNRLFFAIAHRREEIP